MKYKRSNLNLNKSFKTLQNLNFEENENDLLTIIIEF